MKGKKLFGLPRNVAIITIVSTLALLAYLYYRSRKAGQAAQAALPAASDVSTPTADQSTAAPAVGGTPDSGGGFANGSDAGSQALIAGFASQEQLIGELAGGYEQLALSAQAQLGSLAAGLLAVVPTPGTGPAPVTSTPTSTPTSHPESQPASWSQATGGVQSPSHYAVPLPSTLVVGSGDKKRFVYGKI